MDSAVQKKLLSIARETLKNHKSVCIPPLGCVYIWNGFESATLPWEGEQSPLLLAPQGATFDPLSLLWEQTLAQSGVFCANMV